MEALYSRTMQKKYKSDISFQRRLFIWRTCNLENKVKYSAQALGTNKSPDVARIGVGLY